MIRRALFLVLSIGVVLQAAPSVASPPRPGARVVAGPRFGEKLALPGVLSADANRPLAVLVDGLGLIELGPGSKLRVEPAKPDETAVLQLTHGGIRLTSAQSTVTLSGPRNLTIRVLPHAEIGISIEGPDLLVDVRSGAAEALVGPMPSRLEPGLVVYVVRDKATPVQVPRSERPTQTLPRWLTLGRSSLRALSVDRPVKDDWERPPPKDLVWETGGQGEFAEVEGAAATCLDAGGALGAPDLNTEPPEPPEVEKKKGSGK